MGRDRVGQPMGHGGILLNYLPHSDVAVPLAKSGTADGTALKIDTTCDCGTADGTAYFSSESTLLTVVFAAPLSLAISRVVNPSPRSFRINASRSMRSTASRTFRFGALFPSTVHCPWSNDRSIDFGGRSRPVISRHAGLESVADRNAMM
jgi:hypothetical protein